MCGRGHGRLCRCRGPCVQRHGGGRARRWACPAVGVSGGGLEQGCPVPFGGRISTEVEDPAGKVGWF